MMILGFYFKLGEKQGRSDDTREIRSEEMILSFGREWAMSPALQGEDSGIWDWGRRAQESGNLLEKLMRKMGTISLKRHGKMKWRDNLIPALPQAPYFTVWPNDPV